MKKIIHVHQQKIKKGEPALIVRTYKGSKHFISVEIMGDAHLVQSDEPDRCGARVVLATTAKVIGTYADGTTEEFD